MKVAVTYEDGNVFQHFGRTEQFKVYDIQNGNVVSSAIIGSDGMSHGGLVNVLIANKVDALICGGIGDGARNILESQGIKLFPGCDGNSDACVEALAKGTLSYDPDTTCHSHEGKEHDCHCH